MSQTALSQAVGLNLRAIQRVEVGSAGISAADLFAIANVLGTPLNWFFEAPSRLTGEEICSARGSHRDRSAS